MKSPSSSHFPLVEIVLATYNGERYLEEQIVSILSQDYPSIHLLIRDDLSGDGTETLLKTFQKKYPDRITLHRSQERLGIRKNFSALLQHTQAPYVMLSDQDDVWHCDKVKKSLHTLLQLEQTYGPHTPLLVHTDLTVVDQHQHAIASSFWRYTGIDPTTFKTFSRLLGQPAVTGCTVIANRTLLNLALPIPPECIMHDSWLALVASAFGSVETLPEATLLYRQHNHNSIGAQKFYSWKGCKGKWGQFRQAEERKRLQAEKFYSRFHDTLSKDKQEALKAFLSLTTLPLFKRLPAMIQYDLLRDGFLRNLILLCLKKNI